MDDDLRPPDNPAATFWPAFRDPAVDFRPIVFWIWNGDLDPERLRRQVDDIAAHGFGGFSVLPMDQHFRLQDFLRGMSVPYLSDEFFDLMREVVTHAASLGLRVWLYDEGGWPSGSAQGRVVADHPDFRARVLTCRRATPADIGVGADAPANLVAAAAITADGLVLPLDPGHSAPADAAYLLAFEETVVDLAYPDLMNPAAVARFLELTHDRYAEALGDFFGTTIPGIFTDECRLNGALGVDKAPWSPALRDRLAASMPDWQTLLPALFGPETLGFDPFELLGEAFVVEARCVWGDCVSRQFQAAYFNQINQWCEAHNLVHTGHVGGEDELPHHAQNFFHFFRTAGALHAPGVDVIWRQLFPGRQGFSFPALAASALHLRPHGAAPPPDPARQNLVPSESFSVYGYGADFAQFAWVANFQFCRGINRLWPIGYHYDTSDGLVYGTMSHIGPGNPLYRHWPAFNAYLARVSAVVATTGHACDVAVYYPIEALWAYQGRDEALLAWDSCRDICESLMAEQMSFDFLDADAIASAEVTECCLETPGQDYSTVIVPDCSALPAVVMEKLLALHDAGGRVVFLGDGLPAVPTSRADQQRFAAARDRLAELVFALDARRDRESRSSAVWVPIALGAPIMYSDASAAFLGPFPSYGFPPRAIARDAVLLASRDERARVASLLSLVVGGYGLVHRQPTPDLRISSRWLSDNTWLHLAFNEGTETLDLTLDLISEQQVVVEQWDALTAHRHIAAVHEEVTEPTHLRLTLAPGNLTVFVTSPSPTAPDLLQPPGREFTLFVCNEPSEVSIAEQSFIDHGSLISTREAGLLARVADATDWTCLDLPDFSGTLRYRFRLSVAEEYLDRDLWLDLGDVDVAAAVYLNGRHVGNALWPPYRLPVSGLLVAGHNDLVVEVTNTLAPQVLRPDNIDEAAARGWQNPYYRMSLDWHREAPAGALWGPVRLLAVL